MPTFRLRKAFAFAATWPAKVEPDVLLANIISLYSGNLVRVVLGKELYSAPTKGNKWHIHAQVVFEQPRDVTSTDLDGLGCGHGYYQAIHGDHNRHLSYICKEGMVTPWAPSDLATEALRSLIGRLRAEWEERTTEREKWELWAARDKRRLRADKQPDVFRAFFSSSLYPKAPQANDTVLVFGREGRSADRGQRGSVATSV